MCGIYGELDLHGSNRFGQYAQKATDVLRHRGPDDGAVWRGGQIVLGMRRLSILDLPGGMQPIWNEDHTCCIVYNGELYNFRELRQELQTYGHFFRTESDTEVIVHWPCDGSGNDLPGYCQTLAGTLPARKRREGDHSPVLGCRR